MLLSWGKNGHDDKPYIVGYDTLIYPLGRESILYMHPFFSQNTECCDLVVSPSFFAQLYTWYTCVGNNISPALYSHIDSFSSSQTHTSQFCYFAHTRNIHSERESYNYTQVILSVVLVIYTECKKNPHGVMSSHHLSSKCIFSGPLSLIHFRSPSSHHQRFPPKLQLCTIIVWFVIKVYYIDEEQFSRVQRREKGRIYLALFHSKVVVHNYIFVVLPYHPS